jgi:septal ring factor EnvC (AmiA/AmiB activator)
MNKDLTPQEVYETEIEAMKKSISDLEGVVKNTETALQANKILLSGLEQNLKDLHKQNELELVSSTD